MKKIFAFALSLALWACGGYSFTGGDVGDAQTVSIDYFQNYAELVNPQMSPTFTEKFRDVFVQQTPLNLVERGGDLHFEGNITDYVITPINAQANNNDPNNFGGNVAQNRLTVTINVIYQNRLEEAKSFERKFTRFADFDANADLSQVEGELVDQISQELSENILNSAIGNW